MFSASAFWVLKCFFCFLRKGGFNTAIVGGDVTLAGLFYVVRFAVCFTRLALLLPGFATRFDTSFFSIFICFVLLRLRI